MPNKATTSKSPSRRSRSPSKSKAKTAVATSPLDNIKLTTENANLLGAAYVGVYGITLALAAGFFFGAKGFVPYFEDALADGSVQGWFARSFGTQLIALASMYYFAPASELTTKIMTVGLTLMLPVIAMTAFPTTEKPFLKDIPGLGEPAGIGLWQAQTVVHLVICTVMGATAFF